jgi:hypothetical protein
VHLDSTSRRRRSEARHGEELSRFELAAQKAGRCASAASRNGVPSGERRETPGVAASADT